MRGLLKILGLVALPAAALAQSTTTLPAACTSNATLACVQSNGFKVTANGAQVANSQGVVLPGYWVKNGQLLKIDKSKIKTNCAGTNAEECIECVNTNYENGAYAGARPTMQTLYASKIQTCMNLYS
jgi:hypothetical protein